MPTLIPVVIMGGVVVAAVLCLAAFLLLCKRQRTLRQQETGRIVALQRKIDAVLNDDGFESAREAFSVSLKTASLTTGLQRPRLETMAKIDKQPPEKYRILGKLASQGMDAEEIAAILGISSIEAGQLLSLSTMAQIGR
jgi:DNA-directed RNA polymerase specialized sigma24 family protein